ncbi:hypothetical protein UC34_17425 [Pandoraea vervacti]|uniref:Uncharacterized protein n=1 Tax=Pandoraea vervacti TaxID=656178 RepID=A0ABM5T0E3_9BURK|nr:hypothetical protein [Pandoraea vervacti]AJP58270.1 hypothetical protein UC34_17425 [Pandoraea vervacti]
MSVSPATPSIGLLGLVPRSLSADTVAACTKNDIQYQLNTLWERIKDWFLGTHKVAATTAIHTMATTTSVSAQIGAFLDLIGHVRPEHRDQLKWCAGEGEAPYFMIGDTVIASAKDWSARTPMELSPPDMARMLLATHHRETPLLLTFLQIDVSAAPQARATITPEDEDDVVYVDMDAHTDFLRDAPLLRDALEFIGMHRNDEDFKMSRGLGNEVAAQWQSMGLYLVESAEGEPTEGADTMGGMAQNVMVVTTDLFHEHQQMKRNATQGIGGSGSMRSRS